MELQTNDLVLRTLTENDIDEIARMWKYPAKSTLEDAYKALEYMEQTHSLNRVKAICHLCLGVFKKGELTKLIGWCGLDGEIAKGKTVLFYIIAEEFRCRGYATQCAIELLRYAFEDMEYDIIYSSCAKENRSSYRVMEKAGMSRYTIHKDGGFGFFMDKEMYAEISGQSRLCNHNNA